MKYLLPLALGACSFHMNATSTDGGDDAATPDATDCQFSSQTDTCALGMPQNDLVLSGTNAYDTDTGMLNGAPAPHMRLDGMAAPFDALLVRDFHMTLGATLRATGSLPFAVIAFDQVILDGNTRIDVGIGGAGARLTCENGAMAGGDESGGAAGGGGGGFGANGGRGGDGNADGTTAPGGTGGAAAPTPPIGPIGGCPGAHGGKGDVAGGAGGLGGGALYLVAKQQITIASSAGIQAGGGGGGGGGVGGGVFDNGDTGGGGGGAGGMIFLESAVIRSAGILAANGGGGGEASGDGDSGNPGQDAQLGMTAAGGGHNGSPTGTDGGNGGAGTGAAQSVTTASDGGGGGGGGSVGYIIVVSPDAQVAPTSPPSS
jgi:hypothetical protein